MKQKHLLLVAAVLASGLTACTTLAIVLAPAPVTIATANPGAIDNAVGNAICRLYNLTDYAKKGSCVAVGSAGSMANIGLIRSGASTAGLVQSDVAYAAIAAKDLRRGRARNGVANVDCAAFAILHRRRAGGQRHTGFPRSARQADRNRHQRGAGFSLTRDVVFGFYGWKISDLDRALEIGPADQDEVLCDNTVDAIIFEAGHPDGLTQVATTECNGRLVPVSGPPIDRLLAQYPYYVASTIPGGMYVGNPKDVPTFGTRVMLVTSARQPADLAYAMVKAVFENFDDFRRLHPVAVRLDGARSRAERSRDADPSGRDGLLPRSRPYPLARRLAMDQSSSGANGCRFSLRLEIRERPDRDLFPVSAVIAGRPGRRRYERCRPRRDCAPFAGGRVAAAPQRSGGSRSRRCRAAIAKVGANQVAHEVRHTIFGELLSRSINPLNGLLLSLAGRLTSSAICGPRSSSR